MKVLTSHNRAIRIFILFAMINVLSSCSDFLEKPLQGQLTQESFPTTSADALAATTAVYNTLRSPNYHFGLFPIMDIMSDDARKGSNPGDQASTIGPYDTFQHVNTESTINDWWAVLYQGIKRANVVIEKVSAISMDENLRARYVGEASFLRALFYFDLVRAWGGVPLITTTTPPLGTTRASAEDVYTLIINDLNIAINSLPEKTDYPSADVGRATKSAAKAILAKVYLFRGDFVNAEKYALEVINSGLYDLMPDFADANSKAGEFGVESIFEIGAKGFESQENGGDQYANVQGVRGKPNRGWGFNRPSIDLMNAFEPDDPRKDKTILYLGEIIDDVTIEGDGATPDETKDSNGNTIEIECYNQKVWTPGNNVPTQFDHNRRIIRYSDVLLMAAEASNENGNTSQALLYVNKVRERAREGNDILPDLTETNKDLLRDLILKERRVELALEGHRFWDLVRTHKALEILGPLGFKENKNELLGIPQIEMDLTQNIWEQNPGWK